MCAPANHATSTGGPIGQTNSRAPAIHRDQGAAEIMLSVCLHAACPIHQTHSHNSLPIGRTNSQAPAYLAAAPCGLGEPQ